MQKIYKYRLTGGNVSLPEGAEILDIQYQNEKLTMWALVNPAVTKTATRMIEVYGTGESILYGKRIYLKTLQQGPYVWHIFELLS